MRRRGRGSAGRGGVVRGRGSAGRGGVVRRRGRAAREDHPRRARDPPAARPHRATPAAPPGGTRGRRPTAPWPEPTRSRRGHGRRRRRRAGGRPAWRSPVPAGRPRTGQPARSTDVPARRPWRWRESPVLARWADTGACPGGSGERAQQLTSAHSTVDTRGAHPFLPVPSYVDDYAGTTVHKGQTRGVTTGRAVTYTRYVHKAEAVDSVAGWLR